MNKYTEIVTGEIIVAGKYESIKECLEKNRATNLSSAEKKLKILLKKNGS